MMEMIKRIFRPAPKTELNPTGPIAARRVIVRWKATEAQRAELHRWAAGHGVKKYQQSDLQRRAGETLADMEKSSGRWGK